MNILLAIIVITGLGIWLLRLERRGNGWVTMDAYEKLEGEFRALKKSVSDDVSALKDKYYKLEGWVDNHRGHINRFLLVEKKVEKMEYLIDRVRIPTSSLVEEKRE